MVHVAHDARRACPHRHLQVHATFTVVHRPHYAGDIASVRSPHATGTAHAALQLPDVWRGHAAGAHHAGCSTQFTRVRKRSVPALAASAPASGGSMPAAVGSPSAGDILA